MDLLREAARRNQELEKQFGPAISSTFLLDADLLLGRAIRENDLEFAAELRGLLLRSTESGSGKGSGNC